MRLKFSLIIIITLVVILVSAAVTVFYYTQRSTRSSSPLIPEPVLSTIGNAPGTLIVHSESFMNASPIPSKYAYCGGDNYSPSIIVENIPANTESIILLIYDPDAPSGLFYHWVVYGLKGSRVVLPEGSSENTTLLQGSNSYGFIGYSGPCPPPGDKPHRYVFLAIAVDMDTGTWPPGLSPENVLARIKNHVLAYGYIYGTYSK